MSVKDSLTADMKTAMKAGDKSTLGVIRMALAALNQREVDTRDTLTDADAVAVLDKMTKQRRDSIEQYKAGSRDDLAEREQLELEILQQYLPQPLSEAEVDALIDGAITDAGAESMKDMGKVMATLKPKLQGRADMGAVSAKVKGRLSG